MTHENGSVKNASENPDNELRTRITNRSKVINHEYELSHDKDQSTTSKKSQPNE